MSSTHPSTLRRAYLTSMGLGVLAAFVAANGSRLLSDFRLAACFGLWALLTVIPWATNLALPTFSFSEVLRIFTLSGKETIFYRVLGRSIFLLFIPMMLGMLAMYGEHRMAPLFNIYLIALAFVGALQHEDHDGILVNLVTGAGFIFLASLASTPAGIVWSLLAAGGMLHGVTAYLLLLNYPQLDRAAARRLTWLALRRNLLVFAASGVLALVGSLMLHGARRRAISWFVLPPDAEEAGSGIGLLAGIRLLFYVSMALLAAFLIVKMVSTILRDRRRFKPGRLPRIFGQEAEPTGVMHLFGLTGQWFGTRRQIISTYLRTRNQLARLGYDLRISATPREYAAYFARRVHAAQADLDALTDIFLTARYAREAPPPEAAERARDLQQRVVQAVREQAR